MNEQDVTRRVVETLDQGARELPPEVASRLYDLRREAVRRISARHVGQGVLAWTQHHLWAPALLLGLLILAAWYGLTPRERPVAEPNNVDVLLLTDAVPPQAFADWSLVTRDNAEAQCLTVR
ncbi:MAG: DUF3619 family protein [Betaproteobacteria bacterium]|nr:DUF3619 family protein [Betaproteobacteria bacterium]